MLMAVMLCVGAANAQFTQGSKMFSANATGLGLDFTKIKDVDDMHINFGLMGKGSYFVIDNLAITAGLGFNYEKMGDLIDDNAFAFEVGGRYYLVNALYAGLAYEGNKMKDVDLQSYGKLEVGYDIFISDNVFFEPAVYFKKGFGDAAKDVTQFGLSVGIGVTF